MKLITLNVWGGKIAEPLATFVAEQASDTDVFCFQEVFHNGTTQRPIMHGSNPHLFSHLKAMLIGFRGFISIPEEGDHGLAIFVRETIGVEEHGDFFVYRWKNAYIPDDSNTLGKALQYVKVKYQGKTYTIANLHGLWDKRGKIDTPERIEMARKVEAYLSQQQGSKILCGDFNLLPETESLSIMEQGMRNLVREYGVTSTRTSLYRGYRTEPLFADYVLVSSDINVGDFKVLPVAVSDHAPLLVDFT